MTSSVTLTVAATIQRMQTTRVYNDTRRIRRAFQERICEVAASCTIGEFSGTVVETLIPGQTWQIKDASRDPKRRRKATGSATAIVVSFVGVRQETPTLSGGGITVETGICSANVVIPANCKGLQTDELTEAYRIVGSITQSIAAGDRQTMGSLTSGNFTSLTCPDPAKGDLTNLTTTITITGVPNVMPAYRASDDLHIPVMIHYRADTQAHPKAA